MAYHVEAAVREGFICPICMKDLGNVEFLQKHFETVHAQDGSGSVPNSILKRAKNKLKIFEDQPSGELALPSQGQSTGRSFAFYDNPYEIQSSGTERTLTAEFRKIRLCQVNRNAIEMNKLVIRLEKLSAQDAPVDVSRRKVFEQNIVPWVDDSLVNNCPSCGIRFGVSLQSLQDGDLIRRKHHCRLCGYMICSTCSHFLPLTEATRLVQQVHENTRAGPLMSSAAATSQGLPSELDLPGDDGAAARPGLLGFMRRTGSFSSLNQLLPSHTESGEYEIRLCEVCRSSLELKFKQLEEKKKTPFTVRLYEKMKKEMEVVDRELPEYNKMVKSIYSGETKYTLGGVSDFRMHLKTRFEQISNIGKRLAELGQVGDNAELHPREAALLRSIHMHVRHWLEERLTPLRSLPRPDHYESLVREREVRLRASQEEEERKTRVEAAQLRKFSDNSRNGDGRKDSWIPEAPVSKVSSVKEKGCIGDAGNENPMLMLEALLVQISNVRSYLNQAKAAQKMDEVVTLQRNLAELLAEHELRKAELRRRSNSARQ